jgi:hypothetical protein
VGKQVRLLKVGKQKRGRPKQRLDDCINISSFCS